MAADVSVRSGTRQHILIISWADTLTLLVHVKMFNRVGFDVALCSRFDGVWFPVASGHLFDLRAKKVTKMRKFLRMLLP